jgi:hypothetical protein
LEVRIGVNTGEVVADDPSDGQVFATGDPVNVAARLQQAAQPGEILIGESTRRLVGDSVVVTEVAPLAVKGKTGLVRAARVLGVAAPTPPLSPPAGYRFVGRERELQLLRERFERCVQEPACRLVTVLGEAGIGKSRLVREALQEIGTSARILVGRCPPYGEGITYLPLLDIVRQLAPAGQADLAVLVEGEQEGDQVADRVAGAVGLSDTSAPTEETNWAVRRLFEALARRRPLVVVLDDVHWAEPTFLDLVEYVVAAARAVPLLVICLARPELLDARPTWQASSNNATIVRLEPLTKHEARTLLEGVLGEAVVAEATGSRVLQAAEGNPLFLEQLLAMQAEHGEELGVPPTVQAVLAARIDRLPLVERAVVQRAAVQGRVFSRRALAELVDEQDRPRLNQTLAALERRELIRPDPHGFGPTTVFASPTAWFVTRPTSSCPRRRAANSTSGSPDGWSRRPTSGWLNWRRWSGTTWSRPTATVWSWPRWKCAIGPSVPRPPGGWTPRAGAPLSVAISRPRSSSWSGRPRCCRTTIAGVSRSWRASAPG